MLETLVSSGLKVWQKSAQRNISADFIFSQAYLLFIFMSYKWAMKRITLTAYDVVFALARSP